MNKLKLVIGLAPSELTYAKLISRLSAERDRISNILATIRIKGNKKPKPKVSKSKKVTQADLAKIAEMTGVDLSSLMK